MRLIDNEKDFVRRIDVVKAIKEHSFFINNQCTYPSEGCIEVIEDAVNVPPADRPQGEWETEYHGNGWNDYWDYTCSNCGKKYERADAVLYKANYCPNCGAKMKGADDE